MYPFTYTKSADTAEAIAAGQSGGRYIAGGTTLEIGRASCRERVL